jgi:hypothetical protein
VTLTIALSTLLAGFVAEILPPRFAVWTMVSLIAVAGTAWVLFARSAARSPAPAD